MARIALNIIVMCLAFLLVSLSWNFLEAAAERDAEIDSIYTKPDVEIIDRKHFIKRSIDQNLQSEQFHPGNKINSDSHFNENNCSYVGDCASNTQKSHPVCYCDIYCSVFKDCCFDAKVTEKSYVVDKEHYTELLERVECNRDKHLYGTENNVGFYVIQTCPPNYTNLEVKHNCESSNFTQPVTSEDDGITYSNEYCALCNKITNYQYWNTAIFRNSCPRLDLFAINGLSVQERLVFLKDNCENWRFTPDTDSKPRVCRDFLHPSTNSCPTFSNPVQLMSDKSLFRNQLCVPHSQNDIDYQCLFPKDLPSFHKGFGSFAINILFKMHPPTRVKETKTCGNREKYLTDSDMCVPEECHDWNLENQCNLEAYANHEVVLKMVLKGNDEVNGDHALRAVTAIYQFIPTVYQTTVTRVWGWLYPCDNVLQTVASFKVQRKLSLYNLQSFASNLQMLNFTYHEFHKNTNLTLRNLNLTMEEARTNNKCQMQRFTRNRLNFLKTLNIMSTNVSEIVDILPKELEIESHLEVSLTTNELLKITINVICRKHDNNASLSSFNNISVKTIDNLHAQGLITFVFMCVSCVFLICTIFLYIYTKMCNTAPGMLSVHMMTALFLSQIMFMTGIDASDKGYKLCFVLGIMSHYLWLTAFVWVSLFMVHITSTISQVKYNPNASNLNVKHISVIDYVIGYGAAWVIVIPSVILELSKCPIDIGYTTDVCFPTGYPGNLIFFTGPIFLSLLINSCMLVANIRLISLNQKSDRLQSFNIDRSYLCTYVKLTFISSCPWLIGFIGEIVQSELLRYLFIVLSGLHGFIVSLCFLLSERVFKLFKKRPRKSFVTHRQSIEISKQL